MPTLNAIIFKGIVRSNYPNDKSHSLFPLFNNCGMGKSIKEWNMTDEQIKIDWHNRAQAWKHFYPEGNGKPKKGYVLHHRDETLRHTNPERYNKWLIEDLDMLTKQEHASIHKKGTHHTEETRNKISESLSGERHYCFGKHLPEEVCKKISEANKGKYFSEETRQKISEANKGVNNHNFGKHLSAETRRKISEARKGKHYPKLSEAHKKRFLI